MDLQLLEHENLHGYGIDTFKMEVSSGMESWKQHRPDDD